MENDMEQKREAIYFTGVRERKLSSDDGNDEWNTITFSGAEFSEKPHILRPDEDNERVKDA